jgi:hypothetical protein
MVLLNNDWRHRDTNSAEGPRGTKNGATTLSSITTFSITTLSTVGLVATLGINNIHYSNTHHKHLCHYSEAILLIVAFLYCSSECHYAECRGAL